MNSISLQNFLYSIADDMKRPHELFDPIIKRFLNALINI